MPDQSMIDQARVALSAVLTWLGGEAGRAMIAGAAGGLYCWLMAERRRLRDGVVAVVSGALAAQYLGPVVVAMLALTGIAMQGDPQDLTLTAGSCAGWSTAAPKRSRCACRG